VVRAAELYVLALGDEAGKLESFIATASASNEINADKKLAAGIRSASKRLSELRKKMAELDAGIAAVKKEEPQWFGKQ